jgi:hypothetical protein
LKKAGSCPIKRQGPRKPAFHSWMTPRKGIVTISQHLTASSRIVMGPPELPLASVGTRRKYVFIRRPVHADEIACRHLRGLELEYQGDESNWAVRDVRHQPVVHATKMPIVFAITHVSLVPPSAGQSPTTQPRAEPRPDRSTGMMSTCPCRRDAYSIPLLMPAADPQDQWARLQR